MTLVALLVGIPFIISGWRSTARKQTEAGVPVRAAQEVLKRRERAPRILMVNESTGEVHEWEGR